MYVFLVVTSLMITEEKNFLNLLHCVLSSDIREKHIWHKV